MTSFRVTIEKFPIAGDGFTISRETKREAVVVHVALERDGKTGEGECFPLKRYGYTPEAIKADIEAWLQADHNWTRQTLTTTLPAGPARFALDTALWDLAGWPPLQKTQLPTAFTLSGAAPETMAAMAVSHRDFRWLKTKLMGDGLDKARVAQIHAAAPHAQLIVDANEALSLDALEKMLPVLQQNNVVLIEQPLPERDDEALRDFRSPIPIAADESCHTMDDLDNLHGKYDVINIKLDKTGGLTHALQMRDRARDMGFRLMVGCMASTGLGIYPAFHLAQEAEFIDLDGALLLAHDRPDSKITYRNGLVCLVDCML